MSKYNIDEDVKIVSAAISKVLNNGLTNRTAARAGLRASNAVKELRVAQERIVSLELANKMLSKTAADLIKAIEDKQSKEKYEEEKKTLRDEFAGKAMQGIMGTHSRMVQIMTHLEKHGEDALSICDTAYFFADKMLKIRDKKANE